MVGILVFYSSGPLSIGISITAVTFLLLLLIAFAASNRKLQENLTDEMVGLARQLKERSLVMSQSIKNTETVSSHNLLCFEMLVFEGYDAHAMIWCMCLWWFG